MGEVTDLMEMVQTQQALLRKIREIMIWEREDAREKCRQEAGKLRAYYEGRRDVADIVVRWLESKSLKVAETIVAIPDDIREVG